MQTKVGLWVLLPSLITLVVFAASSDADVQILTPEYYCRRMCLPLTLSDTPLFYNNEGRPVPYFEKGCSKVIQPRATAALWTFRNSQAKI